MLFGLGITVLVMSATVLRQTSFLSSPTYMTILSVLELLDFYTHETLNNNQTKEEKGCLIQQLSEQQPSKHRGHLISIVESSSLSCTQWAKNSLLLTQPEKRLVRKANDVKQSIPLSTPSAARPDCLMSSVL